jgi:hypothetical protein
MSHPSFLYRVLLAVVVVALLHPVGRANAQGATAMAALAGHENEDTLSMSGVVTSVRTAKDGTTFVNFGRSWTVTAVIPPAAASVFPHPEQLMGKRVRVTGKIHMIHTRWAMRLDRAEQLQVLKTPESPLVVSP